MPSRSKATLLRTRFPHGILRVLAPALPAALLAPGALASDPPPREESPAEVRRDIEFARGLATHWQFVDLAEDVLGSLEEAEMGGELEEELALARCSIYAEGAKTENRPEEKEALWTKAIDAYQDFLDDYELGEHAAEAERDYVDLANEYGLYLTSRLEEAAGDEARALRDRIEGVLGEAVSRTGELIESMEALGEMTPSQEREYYMLLFNRGQLYVTLGKAAESGEYYFTQAEETLQNLAFEAGETSGFGMFAYLLMGELLSETGRYDYAIHYYEFVVDTAVPRAEEAWQAAKDAQTRAQLQDRWNFAERGVGGLVEAHAVLEQYDEATDWALHYYNTWVGEGLNLSPHGYLSLLAVARTLLRAGGFLGGAPGELQWFATAEERDAAGFNRRQRQSAEGLALAIADQVNRENRGNVLQVRAQRLISEIISHPGVSVPPEVLFEAAKGEQNARNHPAALQAFKRVMAALETSDAATQRLFAPKVCYNLGRTLEGMERRLEAAMAYRQGVTAWRGDPEFDPQNAEGYRRTIAILRRAAPDDERLTSLSREAENLIVEIGVGAEDVLYNQAKRVYDEEDYAAARTAFMEVPGNARNYEKSLVYAALSAFRTGDAETARRELRSYLEEYVQDPTNATTDESRLNTRHEAMAAATYWLARIALEQGDHARVVELTANYDTRFPSQESLAPAALYLGARAQLAQRDFDGADRLYGRMLEKFPDSKFTGVVALEIYRVLDNEHEDAVAEGRAAEAEDLLRRMARNLQISNRLDTTPGFAKLRNESKHWFELGEWERARDVLQRIANLYEAGKLPEARAEDMENFVYPDLAHALLELHNATDAITYLENLVPDPDELEEGKRASSRTVLDYCRAVTGWVEGDEGTFVEVPGVGGEERIDKAAQWLNKIANSLEKWQCEWYGVKFDMAYAYYQWGRIHSAKKGAARSQVHTLRTELGPDLALIRESCGDDVLRRRFLTLWERLQ